MKIRFVAFAAAASLATTAALAAAPAPSRTPAEPTPVVREQTLVEELAAGAREILSAVVPEIALPRLEVKLPALDRDAG